MFEPWTKNGSGDVHVSVCVRLLCACGWRGQVRLTHAAQSSRAYHNTIKLKQIYIRFFNKKGIIIDNNIHLKRINSLKITLLSPITLKQWKRLSFFIENYKRNFILMFLINLCWTHYELALLEQSRNKTFLCFYVFVRAYACTNLRLSAQVSVHVCVCMWVFVCWAGIMPGECLLSGQRQDITGSS